MIGQTRKENEIKPLTAFRFLAAVAVFLSHLDMFENIPALKPVYDRFFYEGYIGVTFFFVLSGFILTYTYRTKIAAFDPGELCKFYVARIARIYPVHLLTFALSVPLVCAAGVSNFAEEAIRAALNLALLQGFVPIKNYYFSFNMPAWSLSDEIFFYALMPVILALWVKWRATSPRRALVVALALWGMAFALVWAWQDSALGHWLFYIAPYFRVFDFALGIALCFIFLGVRDRVGNARARFTGLELGSFAAFALAFFIAPNIPQAFRYGVYYTPWIAGMILIFAFQRGAISAVLSNRWLVLGGEISFSFYMFHQLVLRYFQAGELFATEPVLAAVAAFALTVALSYACYRLYELPWREKIRRSALFASLLPIPSAPPHPAAREANAHGASVSTRRAIILGLVLAALVGVTYFPALRLGFLAETWNSLEWALKLTPAQYLARTFDPRVQVTEYRPLLSLLMWGEFLAFRWDPTGYHLVRIVAHLANVWLLFALVQRVARNGRVALIAALIFAGLPVYHQAIFHVVDPAPEVGFFYLLCVWGWVGYLQRRARGEYGLALVAFALALLGKETSVTLAVTLVLVDRLLIRDQVNWRAWFLRYVPFGVVMAIYLGIEWIVQLNGRFISGGGGWSIGAHAFGNFLNYLALWIFPFTLESPVAYVWIPAAIILFVYFAFRRRSLALLFLLLEGGLLIGMVIWSPRELFAPRYLYTPTMLTAIALALLFDHLWTKLGRARVARVLLAGGIGVLVIANAVGVAAAAAEWSETVRQHRVPFRDIAQRYPDLPAGTFIYLIEPPHLRDLTGMFLMRYGERVQVGATAGDTFTEMLLYPLFRRLGAATPATGSGAAQVADLRGHANPMVFFFDDTGKPVEIRVAHNAPTAAMPAPPLTFVAPIRWEGYEITANRLRRGDTLALFVYWRALAPIEQDYTVFLHLLDARGEIVWGEDVMPRAGAAPTTTWVAGRLVNDPHVIPLDADLPAGAYRLALGLYHQPTLTRLPIVDERGNATAEQIVIGTFQIE